MTPNQGNELVRLALTIGNSNAAQVLLSIPEVHSLAEQHEFYSDEIRGEIDLRALAEDNESSLRALTTGELKRLEAARLCYAAHIEQAGVMHIVDDLRKTLLMRYQQNPAKIKVKDQEIILPASWDEFQSLDLDEQSYQNALISYYKNQNHTAWRFLLKPNPWIAPNAAFIRVDETNRSLRWADFTNYRCLIALLYCAAIDHQTTPTDDFTFESRLDQFINELALIGRAHNWDKKRKRARW